MCVWRGEIKRQRRRDGGIYRYRWRGERGKKIACSRRIDFSVDCDLEYYLIYVTRCINFNVDVDF